MENLIYVVPAMGIVGLLYTLIKFMWVSKQDAGTDRMKEISNYIAEGAMAFLKAEYKHCDRICDRCCIQCISWLYRDESGH